MCAIRWIEIINERKKHIFEHLFWRVYILSQFCYCCRCYWIGKLKKHSPSKIHWKFDIWYLKSAIQHTRNQPNLYCCNIPNILHMIVHLNYYYWIFLFYFYVCCHLFSFFTTINCTNAWNSIWFYLFKRSFQVTCSKFSISLHHLFSILLDDLVTLIKT